MRSIVWLVFVVAFSFAAGTAHALTQTRAPTLCASANIDGGNAWTNTAGAATSGDNSYATASISSGQHTTYLYCANYGFSIPAGAKINGVTVEVVRKASSGGVQDRRVNLIKNYSIGAANRATTANYPLANGSAYYGGASDLWGWPLFPSDVNSARFGVGLEAQMVATSGTPVVSVDSVKITVDYTPFSCTQPANTPAGLSLTCVCDTFDRGSLNPSPIFNSNWIVSTSDSTGIVPSIVNPGYLRLTNNTNDNAKAATVPGIFPAAGNYISVELQHFAYDGSGADGMAVTLSDYSVPAVPGAYGGSLGYAQKTGINGFAGGWLGVALDEFGGFQKEDEGRIGGPGSRPQSVGVRGSGSGVSGYNWLAGTGSLDPEVDDNGSTVPSRGYTYQLIVDARNAPTSAAVSVNRDTGSGYASLVSIPNVFSAAAAQGFTQAPPPTNWQVSFTGSTGSLTNIHELSGLRICALNVVAPSKSVAGGFSVIDEWYGSPPQVAVQNYLSGNIFMKLVGVPFRLDVAALLDNQIVTTYAASGTKNVTVKLVDNSDGVCVLDSSATNHCSATCRSKTAVASQTLAFAPADQGQKQSAAFTINTAYRNLVAIVTDGTTSACSVDSFAVRPTGIASVTSSNATNATTSGTPIFRAGADPFALKLTTTGVGGVASGYTGVAKIDNTAVSPVAPATVAGRIAGTFPAATSGSGSSTATGSAFTYSEVGGFVLAGYSPASDTTSARGVYDGVRTVSECSGLTVAACDALKAATWSGVDGISTASDCITDSYSNAKDANGKYGCNFGLQATTATIGRFVPYEFRVTTPVLTNRQAAACSPASTFSYLDEGMRLQFSLEAREGGGNVTRNYAGALAKLPTTADGAALNLAAAVPLPFSALSANRITGSGFATAWPVMGSANAGTLSMDGTVAVSSLTSATNNRVGPDGPFNGLVLGIAPKDSDGVQILSYDLDADNSGGTGGADHKSIGTTTLYFGQLRLLPAIGSELLPLAMRAEVQRWNGAAFVPNGDDNCTRLPEAQETLSNWRGGLTSGATNITSGALAITGGVGTIKLAAPGAGKNGSVLLTGDVGVAGMPYLGGHWGSAAKYDQAPSATAAFGLYKGPGQIIHWRENY